MTQYRQFIHYQNTHTHAHANREIYHTKKYFLKVLRNFYFFWSTKITINNKIFNIKTIKNNLQISRIANSINMLKGRKRGDK